MGLIRPLQGGFLKLRPTGVDPYWVYFKFPNLFPLIGFPPYVCVEFTNICNLSCDHCWRVAMNRPEGYMEVSLFKKIVSEMSLHKNSILKIGGAGEPGIHPRFRELTKLLAPHSFKVIFILTVPCFALFKRLVQIHAQIGYMMFVTVLNRERPWKNGMFLVNTRPAVG